MKTILVGANTPQSSPKLYEIEDAEMKVVEARIGLSKESRKRCIYALSLHILILISYTNLVSHKPERGRMNTTFSINHTEGEVGRIEARA